MLARMHSRFVISISAVGAAVVLAVLLGTIAHDGLGIPRGTIRLDALVGATFLGICLGGTALRQKK